MVNASLCTVLVYGILSWLCWFPDRVPEQQLEAFIATGKQNTAFHRAWMFALSNDHVHHLAVGIRASVTCVVVFLIKKRKKFIMELLCSTESGSNAYLN